MLAWAKRSLGSDAEAQDAVGEAFERLIAAGPRLRSQEPAVARAYLYTILRHRVARPRRLIVELSDEMAIVVAEAEAEPEWADTGDAELKAAIARLPVGLRTPLLLAYFERLPHKRIAERMSITTLAVTMRLFKAKRKLKSLITEGLP
jgi:RNA polymerase sigma-70 factor (ECF subfamily)